VIELASGEEIPLISRLDINGAFFDIFHNGFLLNFSLESSKSVLQGFIFIHKNKSQVYHLLLIFQK